MMSSNTSDSDFVTVDMPSENDVGPAAAAAATTPLEHNNADNGGDDEESALASHRQRSLLKTLWSEATSTTDLPPPVKDHRLHHRRTRKGSNNNTSGTTDTYPSKHQRRSGGGRHQANRYRVTRGAKIAKRVWLAAFAAFAVSFLIAIHVFLYRVFSGSSNDNNSGNGGVGGIMKNGMPILAIEDEQAKMTLAEAHSHKLSPINLHAIDTSQYTIRINTWHRNEQLLLSINHHAKCEGVKEIQVIWCDADNNPPEDVVHHVSGKVKIEKHAINSLNERFKVLLDPPTLGILSLDDDVLRPCVALDTAFVRWTRHPERMVGFDVRSYVVEEDNSNTKSNWKYGYMSTTESSNRYSMTLPRASFLHRDYLDLYTMALPRPVYTYVAQNLECEDIAMSFLVSSLTGGKPPLIADYWAVKSMVKLYSETKISGGEGHKSTRDACVNDFAASLGLKEDGEWPLQSGKLIHRDTFFGYGAEPEDWPSIDPGTSSSHLQDVIQQMQKLQTSSSSQERMSWLAQEKAETTMEAWSVGMIENTVEWEKRWGD